LSKESDDIDSIEDYLIMSSLSSMKSIHLLWSWRSITLLMERYYRNKTIKRDIRGIKL